jgi:predicted RecA/RadA family phage recombinase
MAKNFIQPGKSIDHTAAAVTDSGDVVVIGSLVGVALTDATIGQTVAVGLEGVFEVPAAAAAITAGAPVYWDADGDPYGGTAGSGAATATATDNVKMGHAVATKALNGPTVPVKLER